jgi:hypothetical protein
MKLFVIESESLLERKFCFSGMLFKNLVGSKKRLSPRKKLLTIETDLSMLSVWLQRREISAVTLVFENRIADIKVICE